MIVIIDLIFVVFMTKYQSLNSVVTKITMPLFWSLPKKKIATYGLGYPILLIVIAQLTIINSDNIYLSCGYYPIVIYSIHSLNFI